jgi:hypothetical protein
MRIGRVSLLITKEVNDLLNKYLVDNIYLLEHMPQTGYEPPA